MDPKIEKLIARSPDALKQINQRNRQPIFDKAKAEEEASKKRLAHIQAGSPKAPEPKKKMRIKKKTTEELESMTEREAGEYKAAWNQQQLDDANQAAMDVANRQAAAREQRNKPQPTQPAQLAVVADEPNPQPTGAEPGEPKNESPKKAESTEVDEAPAPEDESDVDDATQDPAESSGEESHSPEGSDKPDADPDA